MERNKQRDHAMIDEIMTKAEKFAQDSMQFEPKEPAVDETQKSQ